MWIEEYKCGCTADFSRKCDCLGYCATHGAGRRYLHSTRGGFNKEAAKRVRDALVAGGKK